MTAPKTPSRKVFGLGFNKTGTSTLGKCFDILGIAPVARPQVLHDSFQADSFRRFLPDGFPLRGAHSADAQSDPFGEYPYRAICDEVFLHDNHDLAVQVAQNFQGFHDRPWNVGNLYQRLDAEFPGSLFILTWRDPETWWRSTERWLTVAHPEDHAKLHRYLQHLHSADLDRDRFISGYRAHNEAVRAYFGDRQDFLDVNFEQSPGWEALCSFLGCPVPDSPFPHENRQRHDRP